MQERKSVDAKPHDWNRLGLGEIALAAVKHVGFLRPTEIQRELIPHALAGRDVIGQARTGTGKTAAFVLPMMEKLVPGGGVQGLILVPTRELAVQVDDHTRELARLTPFKTAAILGGRGIKSQVQELKARPEIVVGTPGRVMDLLHRKHLSFDLITMVVLDEVDRMLDIGFRDDIRKILKAIETKHQTIFVSATINDEIQKLARSFMNEPVVVDVSRDTLTVENVQQYYVSVHAEDKFPTLVGWITHEHPKLAIVFTNTKHKARRVAQGLKREGVNCKEIHGDLVQERRERVMKSFRAAKIHVLVATDLAARGLDVTQISHVVNYDIPEDSAVYVHRIGRTARMGKTGRAYTFVTPEEGKLLTEVEKLINRQIPQYEPDWLVRRPAPPPEKTAPVEPTAPDTEAPPGTPLRLTVPRARDPLLESLGLRPVKRTLGSRFRSARKFRK